MILGTDFKHFKGFIFPFWEAALWKLGFIKMSQLGHHKSLVSGPQIILIIFHADAGD